MSYSIRLLDSGSSSRHQGILSRHNFHPLKNSCNFKFLKFTTKLKRHFKHHIGNNNKRPSCIATDYKYNSNSVSQNFVDITQYSKTEWKYDFHERYDIIKQIGKGSFGQVWLGIDKETGREVAIKELTKKRGRLSEEKTFAKIDREVSVMKDIQNCIETVRLYGCYVLAESYNIVMEYCSGKDLKYQIKNNKKRVSESIAAAVAFEILLVLKACHSRLILHGDVKTANFILANQYLNPFSSNNTSSSHIALSRGWLKGIDFGCSQYVLDGGRIHNRVGTPVFMAPEVFQRNYSFESDLWSLGIVLYQLLTGRYPFWDNTDAAMMCSVQEVMATVTLKEPDFYTDPWRKASGTCIDFLNSLLDKDYRTRMTVTEALCHPFITNNVYMTGQHDGLYEYYSNIIPGNGFGSRVAPRVKK